MCLGYHPCNCPTSQARALSLSVPSFCFQVPGALSVPVEVEGGERGGGDAEAGDGVGAGVAAVRQPQQEVLEVGHLRVAALGEEDVGRREAAVRQAAGVEELDCDEHLPRPQPEAVEADGGALRAALAVLSEEGLPPVGGGDDVAHGAPRRQPPYEESAGGGQLA